MDYDAYFRLAPALAFVIALIVAAAWVARRAGLGNAPAGGRRKRRLAVVEMVAVDAKRRLVLVRRDDREHLLLVGGDSDIAVERDIPAPPAPPSSEGPQA